MKTFWAIITTVDRYAAPIYRLAFLTSVVIAVVTAVIYHLPWVTTICLDWIGARSADVSNLHTDSGHRLLLSMIVGMSLGFIFVFARISVVQRSRTKALLELRRCIEDHLIFYDEVFNIMSDNDIKDDAALRLISEKVRNHSIFLCSRLAEIFELMTYCPCHASIKTFNQNNNTVVTRTRDALVHNRERAIVDEQLRSFDYDKNTAFKNIIDDASCEMYINNYLKWSSYFYKYNNENVDWKKYYSAAIVMPITSNKNPARINKDTVIGFVCVDNRCGNFNARFSKATLGVFVALITDMMIKLGEMNPTNAGGSDV